MLSCCHLRALHFGALSSLTGKHFLAVVEEQDVEVKVDQDDGVLTNEQSGSMVCKKILRWNYPTFGEKVPVYS